MSSEIKRKNRFAIIMLTSRRQASLSENYSNGSSALTVESTPLIRVSGGSSGLELVAHETTKLVADLDLLFTHEPATFRSTLDQQNCVLLKPLLG